MKKVISILLAVAVVMGIIPLATMAASADSVYVADGSYVYSLTADGKTSEPPISVNGSEGFGSPDGSYNGRVWTDKSVSPKGKGFDVTLSALAQEYVSTNADLIDTTIAVDVIMIMDMSGSMESNKLALIDYDGTTETNATRTKAMAKAMNEAVETIMSTNPKNRVAVYTYQNSTPNVTEFFPLDHYSNKNWSDENPWKNTSKATNNSSGKGSGKYFNFDSGKISTASGLTTGSGASVTSKNATSGSGTPTQYGIVSSVQSTITALNKKSYDVERVPFVLLFTDGIPGTASQAQTFSNTLSTRNMLAHQNNGSDVITAYTVLTAAYQKNQLFSAYESYNKDHKGESAYDVHWYNIGLGVDSTGDPDQGHAFMDPASVKNGTNSKSAKVITEINKVATGNNAAYKDDYVYVEGDKFIYFANTSEKLNEAFEQLGNDIEETSKQVGVPITNITVEGHSASQSLVFTDVIGNRMTVDPDTFVLNDNGKEIKAVYSQADGVYTFPNYKTTVKIIKGTEETVVWDVPANELAMVKFANRKTFRDEDGNFSYIMSDPIRLTYNVIKIEDSEEVMYSNAFISGNTVEATANAEFTVSNDNTWYYDVSLNPDGSFEESTLKDSIKADKDKNNTETAAYALKETVESADTNGGIIKQMHGNNGLMSAVLKVTKTSDSDETIVPGKDITYTIKVENLTDETIKDIDLKDLIPNGTTYKDGDEPVTNNGSDVLIHIDSISGGETQEISYTVTVKDDVNDGSVIKGTDPAVTGVDSKNLDSEVSENDDLDVTVDAKEYSVKYDWGTYTPSGYNLPETKGYYTGSDFTADYTTISKGTVVEIKDQYGNVIKTETFTGWSTESGTISGNDITLKAQWTENDIELDTYNVSYTWSGDIPTNQIKPATTDGYVNNQPYTIDKTFTSETTVKEYDTYGNLTDVYTFSGWDKANGKINNANVVVNGVWSHQTFTAPTGNITYSWGADAPEGLPLPTDTKTYTKGESYTLDTTYTKGYTVPHYDEYGNQDGVYTFSGWTDEGDGKMSDSGVSITGKWTYSDIEVAENSVVYSFTGNVPEGVTLPTYENTYVKGESYTLDSTYTKGYTVPHYDEYGNQDGEYVFEGWSDPNNGVMGDSNAPITGKWTYNSIEVDTNKVTFTPADPSVNGEIDITDNRPVTIDPDGGTVEMPDGQTHDTPFEFVVTDDTSLPDPKKDGYTFAGWEVKEDDDGITISAKYDKDYFVTYIFDSEVPASISANKPSDTNIYHEGDTVTPKEVTETTVIENGVKWTFDGWDADSKTVGSDDVTFTGSWTKDEATHITYSAGDVTPDGFPTIEDDKDYYDGDTYTLPDDIKIGDVFVVTDDEGTVIETWTFEGWDVPDDQTVTTADGEDLVITPKWDKKTNYSITYSWSGDIPCTDADGNYVAPGEEGTEITLPVNGGTYVPGAEFGLDTTYAAAPDATVYIVYDEFGNIRGKYTFGGWENANDGKMTDGDLNITGTWVYEEIEVPNGKITYVFTGDKIPGSDAVTLPVDNKTYTKGETIEITDEYKGTKVNHYDEYGNVDGIYTFEGWVTDSEDGKMDDDGVIVTGNWSYESVDVPTHTITIPDVAKPDVPDTIEVTNNQPVIINPDGGEWKHGGKDNEDAVEIAVTEDFELTPPTRDGYDFKGWDVEISADGTITIKATWEKKAPEEKERDFNIIPIIIGGGVAGGVVAGGIAAGIAAGAVAAAVAVPAAVVAGVIIHKAVKDNKENSADSNSNSQSSDKGSTEEIPDTGSADTGLAVFALLASATGAAFVMLTKKKKEND